MPSSRRPSTSCAHNSPSWGEGAVRHALRAFRHRNFRLFFYGQSLAMIALTGLGIILAAQAISTILQTIVDDDMRGRIMSLFTVAFLGVSPLGSLAAGALANAVGAEHTLFIGGACCALGAIVLWRQLPRLRANIRPIYVRLGIIQE